MSPDQRRFAWQELSLFENHDYVARWFKEKHSRAINSAKTKSINSQFAQAREYFRSYGDSSAIVRPLLLYYGCLSFARGVTLCRSRELTETTLKPSHGLSTVDWASKFSAGLQGALELSVRASSGSFTEFVHAAGNFQHTGYWTEGGRQGTYRAHYPIPLFLTDQSTISLEDILSRDRRFSSLYSKASGRPEKVRYGQITATNDSLDVYILPQGDASPEMLARSFGIDIAAVSQKIMPRMPVSAFHFSVEGSDARERQGNLPVTEFNGGEIIYISDNFENGDRISPLISMYLLSFIAGMLARYFPSKWMALVNNEKGASAQPSLMASMSAIEEEFPHLIRLALI